MRNVDGVVSAEKMLHYVENKCRIYNEVLHGGASDEVVLDVMNEMLACKDMAEALLGVLITLRSDGTILVY